MLPPKSILFIIPVICVLILLPSIIFSQPEITSTELSTIELSSVVTVHNGTTASPGSSSLTMTAPVVDEGEVLIAQITVSGDFEERDVVCTPPGWVSLFRNDYDEKIVQHVFYYVASSTQPAQSYTWHFKSNASACGSSGATLSGKGATGGLLHYTGVDPANPIDAFAGRVASGSGTTATAPSVTTTKDNAEVIRFFSAFKDLTFTTTTSRIYTLGSSNNSEERTAAAYRSTQTTAGSTSQFSATLSSSAEWVTATIALRARTAEAKLAFHVQPTNSKVGTVISPAVQVSAVDYNNNIVTGFNGSISIAIGLNPGNGVLSGTLRKNAQNGIAVFDDLSISKPGDGYTLRATADILLTSTSNSFNIIDAAASIVIISGNNQQGLINTSLSDPLVIEVRNNQGNPIRDVPVLFNIAETPQDATGQSLSVNSGTTNNSGRISTSLTMGNKGGTYRVTASTDGVPNAIFTATVPFYAVSGTISEAGSPLAGVTVRATGGHQQTVTTNSNGNYSFTNIPAGTQNITVTPTQDGYSFQPSSVTISGPVVGNIRNVNFATEPPPTPVLLTPADGSSELNITLTFHWEPAAGAHSYRIQISRGTSNVIVDVSGITETNYIADDLEYGTTYTWRVNATNTSGTSSWSSRWSFTTTNLISHHIPLRRGWNMISSYIDPLDKSIRELFKSDLTDNVALVKDGDGNIYIPLFDIDDIGMWNCTKGYQVYLTYEAETFTFTGIPLKPESNPVPLKSGWNLVSYLGRNESNIIFELENIQDKLILARNGSGYIYIPAGIIDENPINTIGSMVPGEGYQLYLIADAELIYPGGNAPPDYLARTGTQSHSVTNGTMQTTSVYSTVLPTDNNAVLLVKTRDSRNGNEIGVWNESGILVGSGMVQNRIAVITLWGAHSLPDTKTSGALPGEQLRLTLWSDELRKESDLSIVSIYDVTADNYIGNELSYLPDAVWLTEIEIAAEIPVAFALYQNYPNPFNPSTTIQYAVSEQVHVVLDVYNILGQKIKTLVNDEHTAGTYEIVFDGTALSSGIYVYRMHAGDFVETRRFLLLK
jgi:hypothetical protein